MTTGMAGRVVNCAGSDTNVLWIFVLKQFAPRYFFGLELDFAHGRERHTPLPRR
jgi:hypothetical protein